MGIGHHIRKVIKKPIRKVFGRKASKWVSQLITSPLDPAGATRFLNHQKNPLSSKWTFDRLMALLGQQAENESQRLVSSHSASTYNQALRTLDYKYTPLKERLN